MAKGRRPKGDEQKERRRPKGGVATNNRIGKKRLLFPCLPSSHWELTAKFPARIGEAVV